MIRKSFPLFFSLLALGGCVATREDVASLETQIERLEKNMSTMEKKQVELSSQLDGIKTPVMSLNSNLSDTQNLLANFTPRFEELRSQLDGIRKDLNQKVADLASRLSASADALDEMGKNIETKLAEIRKAQTGKPAAKAPAKNGKAPVKKTAAEAEDEEEHGGSSSNGSPLGTFQAAYKDYLAERWDLAEAGFANYLEDEPNGSLADKSLYYSALTAKAKGNSAKAVERLDQVADKFPKSPVVRSALLEKAKIFIQQKKNAEAEGTLEYLTITYPKSSEAAEAKKLLEKLPH